MIYAEFKDREPDWEEAWQYGECTIRVCKCRQLATSSSVLYAADSYSRLHSGPSPVSTEWQFIRVCWPSVGKEKAVVSTIQYSNIEFRLEVYDD